MTEKDKMLRGEFYDMRDPELRRLTHNTKDLIRVYNHLPAENLDLRDQMIRHLFGFCGENVRVNQPTFIDYGGNISLGSNSLINMNGTLLDTGRITIGDHVIIGTGSIVTKSISANTVAYGNPCRVQRVLE